MSRRLLVGLALGLGAACFEPPADSVIFSCEPDGADACPPGYTCESDGCCHRDGSDVEEHSGACKLSDSAGTGTTTAEGSSSETGADTGTTTQGSSSETGADTGTSTGTDTGTSTGTDTGTSVDTGTGTGTGTS